MPNDVINTVTINGTTYDIGGSGGHTIKNPAGTAMTQRSNLQFVDLTVSDDSTNDATKVENIHVIQSESELDNLPDGLYMLDDDEGTVIDGSAVGYDNTNSDLDAENVQDAIDEVVEVLDDKVDKVTNVTDGNLAGLDTNGNLTDSGWAGAKDTRSISGNPISISDLKANQLAKDPIITLEPIQDLHGQSKPYPAGGGKNKLPMSVDDIKATNTTGTWSGNVYTHNGVTYTIITDNANNITGIKVNGTANQNSTFYIVPRQVLTNIANGTSIILNGCPANGSTSTYFLACAKNDWTGTVTDIGDGSSSFNYDSQSNFYIQVRDTKTANNLTFYPMLRLATETDATFVPPSNICPISGYDKVEVLSCGKNLFDIDKVIRNSAISVSGTTITATPVGYNTDLFSGNTGEAGASAKKLYLKAGTYTISFSFVGTAPQLSSIYVNTIDENTLIPNGNIGRKLSGQSFTVPNNSWICLKLVTNATCTLKDIQIEESTSATTYEPYHKATSISESLGQTVYGGTLDVRTGVLKSKTTANIITIDGTANWGEQTNGDNKRYYVTGVASNVNESSTDHICNMALIASGNNASQCYTVDSRFAIYAGSSGTVYLSGSIASDVTSLKAMLNTTPLQICYTVTDAGEKTIQLTPHEIPLLKDYAYLSTNGTSIALDYHNGELASLADVSQLGETVNELGKYVVVNEANDYSFKKVFVPASGSTVFKLKITPVGSTNNTVGGIIFSRYNICSFAIMMNSSNKVLAANLNTLTHVQSGASSVDLTISIDSSTDFALITGNSIYDTWLIEGYSRSGKDYFKAEPVV